MRPCFFSFGDWILYVALAELLRVVCMPRKFLKRYLPDAHSIRNRRELRFLRKLLEDPFLLHLNRRSVAGGLALGLFVAFIPTPAQMLISAALAILLRVNLPISVLAVWITNPVTMVPMFYFCYRIGVLLLGERHVPFEATLQGFWAQIDSIWAPLLLGSTLMGAAAALLGYVTVQILWRLHIVRAWRRRARQRRERD